MRSFDFRLLPSPQKGDERDLTYNYNSESINK